jgi:hypothetical protein
MVLSVARLGDELARLQDEQHEDEPGDYENGKPHKYASEHATPAHHADGIVGARSRRRRRRSASRSTSANGSSWPASRPSGWAWRWGGRAHRSGQRRSSSHALACHDPLRAASTTTPTRPASARSNCSPNADSPIDAGSGAGSNRRRTTRPVGDPAGQRPSPDPEPLGDDRDGNAVGQLSFKVDPQLRRQPARPPIRDRRDVCAVPVR